MILAGCELERRQLRGLWLDGHAPVVTEADATRFVRSVGFALRYDVTRGLPLAAMFRAAGDKRRAIELTNALLARSEVVETNVIANRLVLVQAEVVPAVYALRKRARAPELSHDASRALDLIRNEHHTNSGDVRRHIGIAGRDRPDAADRALEELQREMLIDRGPSSVPQIGIPYLSPEGFPYRAFEEAHPDLVAAAEALKTPDAVCLIIERYLRAAVFVSLRRMASTFRLLFTETEMRAGVAALAGANTLDVRDKNVYLA